MDRRKFLERFGIGVAAVVVAPKVMSEILAPEPTPVIKPITEVPPAFGPGLREQMEIADTRKYVLYTGLKGAQQIEEAIADMNKELIMKARSRGKSNLNMYSSMKDLYKEVGKPEHKSKFF